MNNRPKRICNRATASLEQLEKVIGDLQKKIQTQGEELGRKDARIKELKDELKRKDEYIKQLKYERDIRIDPFVTGITTAYGEPKEFAKIVRCKDCRWYDKGENVVDSWELCKLHNHNTEDDGYCHHGERREE